jgi:hypothetical protein
MKMEKREDFETFDQQEKRARKRLRSKALMKAAVLAGVIVFIVPAGGPWMSAEAFTSVMGQTTYWMGHFFRGLARLASLRAELRAFRPTDELFGK